MFLSRGRVPALLLAVCAALALTGCATWKTSKLPATELIATKHPRAVRLTLVDARVVPVMYAALDRDSISGYLGTYALDQSSLANDPYKYPRVTLPLGDVRKLEWQGISAVKTTIAVIGIGATVALIAAAIMISAEDNGFVPSSSSGGGGSGGEYMSCPRLYSWDGEWWQLDSGTYGGAFLKPLARIDVDNLEHASETNGRVVVRMADEAPETEFVDAVSLVAVDHLPGTGVAPDPTGKIHSFGRLEAPVAAHDFDGGDAMFRVREADDRSWESNLRPRDPALASELRDGLVLTFARPKTPGTPLLVLTGHNTPWSAYLVGQWIGAYGSEEPAWQREAEAHPAEARAAMSRKMADALLEVSIWRAGAWERAGIFWEAGPEVAKRQVLPLDLSRVSGDTVRVRLSSIPSFWLVDQVALAPAAASPVCTQEMSLAAASDSTGRDVRSELSAIDGRTYRMERGEAARLSFFAPARRAGYDRTYLARTSGWYRVACDTTRTPDRKLLARLATEPSATARIAVERGNQALQVAGEVLR